MRRVRHFKITDIFIGVIFFLLLISVGVVFTVNFRPLYYLDIKLLNIPETSGYPRDEIIANYNALIDYSSPFYKGSLSFPTLEASPSGLQHFKEVKDIFTLFYVLGAFSLIAAVIIIIYKSRRKDISYLAVSALVSVILPAIIALLLALDFDTVFLVFHKIFFNNDYWIFDPLTDPVINILPESFFLHCAMMIIFIILLGSLIMYIVYLCLKRHSGIKYRKIRGLKV